MKTITPKSYARWARSLIAQGRAVSFARRYLQTLRRRRVLKEGIALAQAESMRHNPLALIKFTPPLSVAGCGSEIIVRAEKMLLDGIPIAIEKDDKGRHRGTQIDEVIELLGTEGRRDRGTKWTELEVLELYRRSMSAHPSLLHKHPESRYRRIPSLLLRLDLDRVDLEDTLQKVIVQEYNDVLFTATVDSLSLRSVLLDRNEPVVIGCDGKSVRIDGKQLRTLKASGRGLASVRVRHLRALASIGDSVEIECRLSGWVGVAGHKRRKFKYFGSDE